MKWLKLIPLVSELHAFANPVSISSLMDATTDPFTVTLNVLSTLTGCAWLAYTETEGIEVDNAVDTTLDAGGG